MREQDDLTSSFRGTFLAALLEGSDWVLSGSSGGSEVNSSSTVYTSILHKYFVMF